MLIYLDGAIRSRLVARGALAGAQVGCGGPGGYPDSQWPRTCLICLWKPSQPLIWGFDGECWTPYSNSEVSEHWCPTNITAARAIM